MRVTFRSLWILLLAFGFSANAQESIADQIKVLMQQVNALQTTLSDLQGVVQDQQVQIETLADENTKLREGAASSTVPPPPPPMPVVSAPQASTQFNPDIGIVVDIVGGFPESQSDEEGNDRIAVRELELVIGHDIDTYARFDSTITFSDFEDVAIEEAYVTYWDLIGGVQARVGRMRPRIGVASALHRDQLDTVDEPLVIQRYLGLEGLFLTGVELSRFSPSFADPLTHELIVGVFEGGIGEDGSMFGEARRHPTYMARLKTAWDISPSTSLVLGGTYLLGSSSEEDRADVQAFATDLTLNHLFSSTRKLKWQSELFTQFRDDSFSTNDDPLGFYSLINFQTNARWAFGARYDWVELSSVEAGFRDDTDRAYSVYVTFLQSEFARLTLQYQLADLAEGGTDNRLFLQGSFAVGTHKHKLQ